MASVIDVVPIGVDGYVVGKWLVKLIAHFGFRDAVDGDIGNIVGNHFLPIVVG